MRDVNYGWLVRYAHSNGASFFFICVYIHIARGLYYGSYTKPRTGLWTVGVIIYFLMMGTAFLGYYYSLICYNFLSNLAPNLNHAGLIFLPDFVDNLLAHHTYYVGVVPIFSCFLPNRLGSLGFQTNSRKPFSNFTRHTCHGTCGENSLCSFSSIARPQIPEAVKLYSNLHSLASQLQIKDDNRNKAAIYCIFNSLTGEKYIGSASTNRINTKFRNHCIHGTGSSKLRDAINKYGLENFYFLILEYSSDLVLKENLKKSHLNLLALENKWFTIYSPEYNILKDATSSFGYKHSSETINKMKKNYSEERKIRIGLLNKKSSTHVPGTWFAKYLSEKSILSIAALERYVTQPNLRKILAEKASKPVILYLKDNITIHSKYSSIRNMAKAFSCCHKTINKAIKNNTVFKEIGYIKYMDNISPRD